MKALLMHFNVHFTNQLTDFWAIVYSYTIDGSGTTILKSGA
jgi:hypothetical protein